MESDLESLPDQDMSSHSSSSRASTPTQPENFYSTCQKKKLIELELKTYTDSIDHTQILIKNLERQGLQNHPIYTNNCKMIQGLIHQRELLTGFPRRNNNPNPLILLGRPIPWTEETKYLGVTLDTRLRYNSHITNTCNKFKTTLQSLQPILRRKSKLFLKNKILIYKLYLQPILSYACAIWGNTIDHNIKKLQVHQNRAIRLITGALTFIPRSILHNETNIEPITQLIRKLATTFYATISNHENPAINSISRSTNYDGTRRSPATSQIIQHLF
ncbi:putative RNA-directed DNA polymerase from transposon X-element [Nephila pilipes]|uniref:Putative RNA-directed DNA polymerase from transposon X-element n=1 Tax=Nephila pilipes TaxID=299642 RepID=A0A8X6R3Q6_NEPPI|nr:putative RNA-directed DNA polymerase from transposon X-element [Nephila pilipes]